MQDTSKEVTGVVTDIVSSVDAPLVIVDDLGGIRIANQRFGRLVGRPHVALAGVSLGDVLSVGDMELLVEKIANAIARHGAPWLESMTVRTESGEEQVLQARFSVIRSDESRFCVLGHFQEAAQPAAETEAPQTSETKMRDLLGSKAGNVTAGQLQLIGLDDVRTTFGDRWQKLAGKVQGIVEAVLKSRLSDEDVFSRDEDGNYVICFATLSKEEAWVKTRALKKEIRERLLGTDAGEEPLLIDIDPGTRERVATATAQAHDIVVTKEDIDACADVVGLVKTRLDEAATSLREHADTILESLIADCATRFRGVKGKKGKLAPFEIAEFDKTSQTRSIQLRNIFADAPAILGRLDVLLIGRAIERLYNMHTNKLPLLVVDVHFSTLADEELARDYFDILDGIVGEAAKAFIFNVREIPLEASGEAVDEVFRTLRPYTRLVCLQLDTPSLRNIDIKKLRVAMVKIDYDELQSMLARNPPAVNALVDTLRDNNVRTVIDNVAVVSGSQAPLGVEVDYVATHPLSMVA